MLKFWNKRENLVLADGIERTPEQVYQAGFGWARHADAVVLDVQGGIVGAIENLAILCGVYGVDENLAPAEALEQIKAARAKMAEESQNAVSVEERTAAALEFLAMNSLPDAE